MLEEIWEDQSIVLVELVDLSIQLEQELMEIIIFQAQCLRQVKEKLWDC